jgi:hypothetical protein
MTRHDISRDEVARQARSLGSPTASDQRALANTFEALLTSDTTAQQRVDALLGRRRLFQIGGFSVATAALVAACGGGTTSPGVAKIGEYPTTTVLPDAKVDDVVLLRTASSLEHSVISLYDVVIANADLIDPKYLDVVKRFRDDHAAHAATVEQLTADQGGEPWTCGNPRIDTLLVPAILRAIQGGPAEDGLAEMAPSDDPRRDVLNVAYALESLAGSTYQSLMPSLSLPSLRKDAITIASQEVRHAAILAIAATGRPLGYVNPDDITAAGGVPPAPETTAPAAEGTTPIMAIPTAYAIPTQFGNLGATPLIIGAPNDIGNRVSINLETPSLNSLVYEYMTPDC